MIQLTVERISSLVKLEDIYIATNKDYKELALEAATRYSGKKYSL